MKKIDENINRNQFGGTSTTDPLVVIIHRLSEATDKLDHYVRVALLDFSKDFDLINHYTLFVKLKQCDLPSPIRRWIATFVLDRTQHSVDIAARWTLHNDMKINSVKSK